MRRLLLAAGALALLLAAPARASDDPAQLARAVADEVVHVDDRAGGRVSAAEAGELRIRIAQRAIGRIKILVVPPAAAERNGGLPALTASVAQRIELRGALIAVAGSEVRVASSYDSGPAVAAVQRAMGGRVERRIAAELERAVDEVARADPGPSAAEGGGGAAGLPGSLGDDLGTNDFLDDIGDTVRVVAFSIVGVILLVVLIPFVVWGVRARRRRRAGEEDLEVARAAAQEQLVAVGEIVRELDIDAEMPGADPAGREALGKAIELYHRADLELAKASNARRLDRARVTLNQARSQANIAQRRLSGAPSVPAVE